MTLAHRVGRLLGSSASEAVYRCGNCEAEFEYDRHVCSACGSFLIERTTYEDLLEVR